MIISNFYTFLKYHNRSIALTHVLKFEGSPSSRLGNCHKFSSRCGIDGKILKTPKSKQGIGWHYSPYFHHFPDTQLRIAVVRPI